jgi:hypothetical protein
VDIATQVDPVRALELELVREELRVIEHELQRRRWLSNPEAWCEERIGDTLWSGQRRILQSVRDNRRTAVPSCHEVSKTFTASRIVAWWLDTHLPGEAFVITSAPTDTQVRVLLWREIGRLHARARLKGRVNQTEWYMRMPQGNEELVAFGRKPADYNPTAFQGIHAHYVLFVLDESSGVASELWDAADSMIANDYSKALVIGNPDDPTSEFEKACRPGSGYNVVRLDAFSSPNFTGEPLPEKIKQVLIGRTYVEEKRRKWAPTWIWNEETRQYEPPEGEKITDTHPYWQSKILGLFPSNADSQSLIPVAWVEAAKNRVIKPKDDDPSELGQDVGGGGDESTCAHRYGGRVRIKWSDRNPDTMQTCGKLLGTLRETGASRAKVDSIGIGRGIADRAAELSEPVVAVNVSERPQADEKDEKDKKDEDFINLRAQGYWNLRGLFERGEIDIDAIDEELAEELVNIRYKRTSSGKIQIESKDEYRRRMRGLSPNRADSVMLAYLDVPEIIYKSPVW